MSLEDVMTMNRDAARKSKRNVDVKAIRARVKVAATRMNKELAVTRKAEKPRKRRPALTTASTPIAAPKPVRVADAVPGKISVKRAVLDLFYAVPGTVISTQNAVSRLQAQHRGMNESSIRVWITDFQADGSLIKAGSDGRKVLLKSGKPGKFALRGT